jgi:hypothetical protein
VASAPEGVALLWNPPELVTMPERGSALVVLSGCVELSCAPTELCGLSEAGPSADEVSDPDDALEDVELDGSDADDPVSEGSATATHGVVATAVPMPSATASAPMRPTYFA